MRSPGIRGEAMIMDEKNVCPKCGEKMRMTSARWSRYWAGRMVETWTCPECEWTETREERRWD